MELPLTLPEAAPDDDIGDTPTSPASLKKWFENLHMVNVAESSHEIHKTLILINRIPIEADDRLKMMELFREPVNLVTDKLQKSYADEALPLSEKHQLTAEQVRHFYIEMAYGYKHVIEDKYLKLKSRLTGRHAAITCL